LIYKRKEKLKKKTDKFYSSTKTI